MRYKVLIGSRIFSKNLGYFQNIRFSLEIKINKIQINFIFWLLPCSKLIWSRNSHWNKTSTQTFHKITYNTVIFTTLSIQFLDIYCLYFSKVLAFLDYILSLAKAWDISKKDWTFSIKRKFLSKNFTRLRTKIPVL